MDREIVRLECLKIASVRRRTTSEALDEAMAFEAYVTEPVAEKNVKPAKGKVDKPNSKGPTDS